MTDDADENSTLQQHAASDGSGGAPRRRTRTGAPRGNANVMRHGCTLGKLPERQGLGYVQTLANAFRRELEAAVVALNGGANPTMLQAVRIDSAAKHHRASLMAHKWLRDGYAEMKPEERIRALDPATAFSDRRNAAIAKLGLAGAGAPPYDADLFAEAMAEIRGENN